MIKLLIILCVTLLNLQAPAERRITFYWASEEHWGNTVADPAIMRYGDPGIESWNMRWCAVNDTRTYPFGAVIWIRGLGPFVVHDHCPQPNTIDIRVPERYMARYYRDVWVIWKPK